MSKNKSIKRKKSNESKRFNHTKITTKVDTTSYPSFSFRYCCNNRYGIEQCPNDLKKKLAIRIFRYSRLKWNVIHTNGRHQWGSESIPQSVIKPNLPQIITPDTTLHVLRFSGKNHAMVGFREEGIFYILYLDHDFSVYNHG